MKTSFLITVLMLVFSNSTFAKENKFEELVKKFNKSVDFQDPSFEGKSLLALTLYEAEETDRRNRSAGSAAILQRANQFCSFVKLGKATYFETRALAVSEEVGVIYINGGRIFSTTAAPGIACQYDGWGDCFATTVIYHPQVFTKLSCTLK